MSSKEAAVTDAAEPAESDQSSKAQQLSETPSSEPEGVEALSLDVIFEVLKNQRRRYVLRYLKDHQATVALGDLAEHVAARENGKTIDAITSDERKRVYVGLYQCHLPKMDDMGIVDFNRDRGRVTLTDTASQLDEYLDQGAADPSLRWYRVYGSLAALGLAAAGAVQFGVEPVSSAPTLAMGAVVGAFAVCSAVHAASATLLDRQ